MAKCPECNTAQEWAKLFKMNNFTPIVCPVCGTKLQYNRRRYSIIIGISFVIFVLPLAPFFTIIKFGYLWAYILLIPFCIVWIRFTKLEVFSGRDETD